MALGTPILGAIQNSALNATSVSCNIPTGTVGDILVLVLGMKPAIANGGSVTTPSGWVLQESLTGAGGYGTTLGADTGNTNLYIFTKTAGATDSGNFSTTISGNNITWSAVVRISNSGGTFSYVTADGQQSTTPTTSLSVTLASASIAAQVGDVFVTAMVIPTDVTTPAQFTNTQTTISGLTVTNGELGEADSSTGNDLAGVISYSKVTAGTATGNPVFSATLAGTITNVRGPVATIHIRETLTARTGTLDATETGSDSFSAAGEVIVSGALAVAETGTDTFSASGLVQEMASTGALIATETGTDTFSSTGDVIVKGNLSVFETGNDVFVATGDVIVQGSLAVTETGTDTFNGTGVATNAVSGSLSTTENSDTFTGLGTILVKGSITALETDIDTFTSIGVATEARSGSMSATENVDSLGSYTVDGYVTDGYTLNGWQGFVYYEIPLPSTVLAGVRYGPNGAYVGTATGGGTGTRIEINSGKIVKLVGSTGALLIS